MIKCSCTFCPPKKMDWGVIPMLWEIIYSKCILSTFYLINVGTLRWRPATQTVSWNHYHSASAHYFSRWSQNDSVQTLPFLILPFILGLFMSLDMKGIKRYCKVWCLRFEGASAESSKMLRIPNYEALESFTYLF